MRCLICNAKLNSDEPDYFLNRKYYCNKVEHCTIYFNAETKEIDHYDLYISNEIGDYFIRGNRRYKITCYSRKFYIEYEFSYLFNFYIPLIQDRNGIFQTDILFNKDKIKLYKVFS
jgi:hypothetical protein